MINFEEFVKGIHQAVVAANQSVTQENLKIFENYFEDADGAGDAEGERTGMTEFIEGVEDQLTKGMKNQAAKAEILKAIERVKKEQAKRDASLQRLPSLMKAKTVNIEFPEETSEGIQTRIIEVPLFSLVPIHATRISEIKFRADLEVVENEEQIMIAFSQQRTSDNGDAAGNASVEVSIGPDTNPEGLQKLIEGYSKVLRAQIP